MPRGPALVARRYFSPIWVTSRNPREAWRGSRSPARAGADEGFHQVTALDEYQHPDRDQHDAAALVDSERLRAAAEDHVGAELRIRGSAGGRGEVLGRSDDRTRAKSRAGRQ